MYEGSWRVLSIRAESELKSLCGTTIGDSVFCPPYVEGEYHALWGGRIVENACIVYPLYTSETTQDGLPYPPFHEEGYTYDPYRVHELFELMGQHSAILDIPAFHAQTASIHVVIQDDWGRHTSASFDIPVHPLVYETNYSPWGTRPRFYFADQSSNLYHQVSSHASSPYQLRTCSAAFELDLVVCIYFCRDSDAFAMGLRPCPLCFGLRK